LVDTLFESLENDIPVKCYHCRWIYSKMCPRDVDYVGRYMSNPDIIKKRRDNICHRFVMTNDERERRWNQVMYKLHENTTPEKERDYPF